MRPHLDEPVTLGIAVIVRHERGAHHLAKVAENGTQVLRTAKRVGGTNGRTGGEDGSLKGGKLHAQKKKHSMTTQDVDVDYL